MLEWILEFGTLITAGLFLSCLPQLKDSGLEATPGLFISKEERRIELFYSSVMSDAISAIFEVLGFSNASAHLLT